MILKERYQHLKKMLPRKIVWTVFTQKLATGEICAEQGIILKTVIAGNFSSAEFCS